MPMPELPPIPFGTPIFGWRVVGRDLEREGNYTICLCKCGLVRSVQTGQLRGKHTRQCKGCAVRGRKEKRHGLHQENDSLP